MIARRLLAAASLLALAHGPAMAREAGFDPSHVRLAFAVRDPQYRSIQDRIADAEGQERRRAQCHCQRGEQGGCQRLRELESN